MQSQKSKATGDGKDNGIVTVFEDNPCWGSPTQHRLEDLLSLVDRNTSIIYDSPQYLVLNKPPDLRMDGAYSATVHKLLTYWYPSPSLLTLAKFKQKSKTTTESKTIAENEVDSNDSSNNSLLLEAVSRLHQLNDVHDNFLRPCHQLDYATSGILLVAKSKAAASHIARLFEERHEGVQKSYVAIVVGDLRKFMFCDRKENEISMGIDQKIPMWAGGTTETELRAQLKRIEESYRRSRVAAGKQHCRVRAASKCRDKEKKGNKPSFSGSTFQGFQPPHAIFAKWKSKMKAISTKNIPTENDVAARDESSPLKKRQKRRRQKRRSASELLTEDDWQRILDPLNKIVGGSTKASELTPAIDFQRLEWKQLREKHPALKQAVIQATDVHNNILRNAIRDTEKVENSSGGDDTKHGKAFPAVFRLSNDTPSTDNDDHDERCAEYSGIDNNTLYIYCPLAQHPDQFNMVVPPNVARVYPHLPTIPGSDSPCDKDGDPLSDNKIQFRPSLTKCTVLERGTLFAGDNMERKIDVTKVRLYPITGRRHQLRVHMALTGFPILGDVTYGGDRYVDRMKDHCDTNTERSMVTDLCSRMCLHAQSLQLPTLLGESTTDWKISTFDPFMLGSDGKLQIK